MKGDYLRISVISRNPFIRKEQDMIVTNIDGAVYTSMNNRFDRNTYILHPSDGKFYKWGDAALTADEWLTAGQDSDGVWE